MGLLWSVVLFVTYPDKIEITEITYGTKVEKIIEAIETESKKEHLERYLTSARS